MYSENLDLCPSVCLLIPGGLIQLRLLKQGVGDQLLESNKHLFCFAPHFLPFECNQAIEARKNQVNIAYVVWMHHADDGD